jgi:hypothetical protein
VEQKEKYVSRICLTILRICLLFSTSSERVVSAHTVYDGIAPTPLLHNSADPPTPIHPARKPKIPPQFIQPELDDKPIRAPTPPSPETAFQDAVRFFFEPLNSLVCFSRSHFAVLTYAIEQSVTVTPIFSFPDVDTRKRKRPVDDAGDTMLDPETGNRATKRLRDAGANHRPKRFEEDVEPIRGGKKRAAADDTDIELNPVKKRQRKTDVDFSKVVLRRSQRLASRKN